MMAADVPIEMSSCCSSEAALPVGEARPGLNSAAAAVANMDASMLPPPPLPTLPLEIDPTEKAMGAPMDTSVAIIHEGG